GSTVNPYRHPFPTRRSSDLLVPIDAEPQPRDERRFEYGAHGRRIRLFRAEREASAVDDLGIVVAEARRAGNIAIVDDALGRTRLDRKSTRLNSSHVKISYAV